MTRLQGVRSGTGPQEARCTNDRVIRKKQYTCDACGTGPLHEPLLQACGCSFIRKDHYVVCRTCAIAFDLVTKGHTLIKTEVSGDVVRFVLALIKRSEKVEALPCTSSE